MKFRRFNQHGLDAFASELNRLREDSKHEFAVSIVTDPRFSEQLTPEIEAEPRDFETRMDFAEWLAAAASAANTEVPRNDIGFWAWLTAALFDQVCPKNEKGARKVGAGARYIPDLSRWTRRYRHLLANPYNVYLLHSDDPWRAAAVMVNPLDQPGELTEQFTARLDLITCPGTMALASRLFIDPVSRKRRRGASGTSARRLGKLLNQYTRTWDLASIDPGDFSHKLPREFKRFTA